ncbi:MULTISPECIES: hypothetical protein [Aeromonas]|jgi:hypothetical protein|uniref:Uncharacterized protein n=1 Tax=Aeromonas rivipollensis TaxID=948519 RepID=A0AAP6SZT0_9GAMM|nr:MULTISPECIES: hypothetical protein [Aeromonas]MBP6166587.1 hypothetical protein [Aeromonas sp.]MDU1144623.1 hypothetical protein [Aeromonas hydrophila]AVP92712.1 hypothetical protein C7N77_05520 [Aeromonas rivipollensis]MBS4701062.1 hypothetical protein [Aeromonas media]MCE9943682.1 hypothetical protein [Aeromonas rivipollensis]
MTDDPWALCHLDDSFDASVLGTKGAQIQWFEDRESLIQFLLEDFVDLLADVGELDEDQTESARERFTLLVEQSQDDRTLMDAINDLASGLRRIAWLGPLSELAEISDDFASGLRAFFWTQYDGDEDDPEAWVPEDLWPQLVECAEEYMVEGDF